MANDYSLVVYALTMHLSSFEFSRQKFFREKKAPSAFTCSSGVIIIRKKATCRPRGFLPSRGKKDVWFGIEATQTYSTPFLPYFPSHLIFYFYNILPGSFYLIFTPSSNGTDALNYTACHPPAVEEFPEDLFTADQRESGAIFVHVAAAVYLIIALGVSEMLNQPS